MASLPRTVALYLTLLIALVSPARLAAQVAPGAAPEPDVNTLAALGIRRIASAHLALFTDLPPSAEVNELPQVFEQAVPQWVEYFSATHEQAANWRVNAYLIVDKERFRRAGLLPANLPPFLNGYARGRELWVYEQPTPYYRRHLLLHEGTHAFMAHVYGTIGPPWYAEGIAELLATHDWRAGKLQLHYYPRTREEVPALGRIKLLQDDLAAGRQLTVGDCLAFGPDAHLRNDAYAWSWALATVIEQRPAWRKVFRGLQRDGAQVDFSKRFGERLGPELRELTDAWSVFTSEVMHGYDLDRAAIQFAPGTTLPAAGTTVAVEAARGWQSARVTLKAGVTYELIATGECVVANEPRPWRSEPDGVTIRYYRGQPLGKLLAVARPDGLAKDAESPFLRPLAIGARGTIQSPVDATLYLRVNDSPAELADNTGRYSVQVEPAKSK